MPSCSPPGATGPSSRSSRAGDPARKEQDDEHHAESSRTTPLTSGVAYYTSEENANGETVWKWRAYHGATHTISERPPPSGYPGAPPHAEAAEIRPGPVSLLL